MSRLILLYCLFFLSPAYVVGQSKKPLFVFDLSIQGNTIQNKFSNFNYFDKNKWISEELEKLPDDYFLKNYPSITTIQLMGAIGGNVERDLFVSPLDNNVTNDYDFSKLIKACRNIIRKGLIPHICLTSVPLKLSKQPQIGYFGVNVKEPDNFDAWYTYIRAIANELKSQFGLKEIRNWKWQIGVEYENKNWFNAGTPETTKIMFFKLYDYGEAALEDVLGKKNVFIGTHAMACADSYWDELSLFDHVAKEKNYKTGKIGTRLDFYAISYYDPLPCTMNSLRLLSVINRAINKAHSVGLNNLKFGVNEGRVLTGWDFKELETRVTQHPIQGPADAKLFKTLVENNIDYFSSWSDGSINGPPLLIFNTMNLLYKMVGNQVVHSYSNLNKLTNYTDEVDGMASYNASRNICNFFVYNNNNNPNEKASESVIIALTNIQSVPDKTLSVRRWILNEDHSNWWKEWASDCLNNGIVDSSYNWSSYLNTPQKKKIWSVNSDKYYRLGKLTSTEESIEIKDNQLLINITIPHHSLFFYEIEFVQPINSK